MPTGQRCCCCAPSRGLAEPPADRCTPSHSTTPAAAQQGVHMHAACLQRGQPSAAGRGEGGLNGQRRTCISACMSRPRSRSSPAVVRMAHADMRPSPMKKRYPIAMQKGCLSAGCGGAGAALVGCAPTQAAVQAHMAPASQPVSAKPYQRALYVSTHHPKRVPLYELNASDRDRTNSKKCSTLGHAATRRARTATASNIASAGWNSARNDQALARLPAIETLRCYGPKLPWRDSGSCGQRRRCGRQNRRLTASAVPGRSGGRCANWPLKASQIPEPSLECIGCNYKRAVPVW